MFFTQDDYKKIQQWLIKNSVKDTEFNEANIPFNGNEIVSIVQGNQNKKVFLKDLVSQIFNLGVSDFINITDKYEASYITLEEAIRYIPSKARKVGQIITFLSEEGNWHIYQFRGVLNQWNTLDKWEDLFDWEKLVINSILPDEEDLTKSLPDKYGNSYLSLKDRKYNPEDFSGLGRVILRKNIVEVEDSIYGKGKKNILIQGMINEPNTIYEIRYDFDLNGGEITIPEGCVLDFQGGSLSNGTIKGTNTVIKAGLEKIFGLDVELIGSWNVVESYSEWFGSQKNVKIDNSIYINKALNYFNYVCLSKGVYYIDNPIIMTSYNKLHGKGGDSTKGTSIIKNTNNVATSIPITNYKVDLNVDAIIIIVPDANDPAGANQYNEVSVKDIYIQSKNGEYGIIASDGRRIEIENVLCRFAQYSFVIDYSFFVNLVNCTAQPSYGPENNTFSDSTGFRINTKDTVSRWTTINLTRCYANSCHDGYIIMNSSYSTMNNCACDAAINTAYDFNNCHGLSINGNGCESCKMEDRSIAAIYRFQQTQASILSCDSSNHKQHDTESYSILAANNSYITVINFNERTAHPLKYKAYGYSSIIMQGYRAFDLTLLIGSSDSKVVVITNSGMTQVGESNEGIYFSSILSSSNYKDRLPIADKDNVGLMPASCLPSDTLPNDITDADQLMTGSFYVGAEFPNIPVKEHGCVTSFCTNVVGFQLYSALLSKTLYVRFKVQTFGKWYIINKNETTTILSGTSEQRPSISTTKGFQYFDTTLNKPIWWTGEKWVDATGAEV